MRLRSLLLSALTCANCGGKGTSPGACGSNQECKAGEVCIDDQCAQLCHTDLNCAAGEICDRDVCGPGERTEPQIAAIDGDGDLDGAPDHARHLVHAGLVVSGRNLAGAGAVLLAAGGDEHSLEVRTGASDTRLEVDLPADVAPGDFILRVTNAAGSDRGSLTLLQGGPGPPGSDATVTGDAVMLAMQAYSGSDSIPISLLPTGSVAGTVATGDHDHDAAYLAQQSYRGLGAGVHRIDLRGVGMEYPGWGQIGRRIALDGVDVHTSGRGLSVVVFDRATMEVSSAATYDTYACDEPSGNPVNAVNLRTMLEGLDEAKLVAVASHDEWVRCLKNSGLEAALKDLGGSDVLDVVRLLSPDNPARQYGYRSSYLLLGIPGIGAGNGIERIQPNSANGYVETSVVVVDGTPVGMATVSPAYTHDDCVTVSGECGVDVACQPNFYLDRLHATCPPGYFLVGFGFGRCDDANGATSSCTEDEVDGLRLNLECCR